MFAVTGLSVGLSEGIQGEGPHLRGSTRKLSIAVILRMAVASLGLEIAFRACIPGVLRAALPSLSTTCARVESIPNQLCINI